MDPALMALVGGGGAPAGAPPMGAPMGAPDPMAGGGAPAGGGLPTPVDAAMQALMGVKPQVDALEQQQAALVQDAMLQALMGAPDPAAMQAMTGPVAPGGLDAASDMQGIPDAGGQNDAPVDQGMPY